MVLLSLHSGTLRQRTERGRGDEREEEEREQREEGGEREERREVRGEGT